MMMMLQVVLLLVLISLHLSSSFLLHSTKSLKRFHNNAVKLQARVKKTDDAAVEDAPTFVVGENIPEDIKKQNAIYDMILVERFNAAEKTAFGLFLPKIDGKDQKHVGKVLSMPLTYGLESEQGRLQTIQEIAPYKVGDIVYIQDPWGIGPKDQTVGQRCFSFHKADHILGKIA